LPGRAVRPLTNALVRIMSGRSARPGNPDEAKGGRRDPVLALPRLGGSIPPAPSTVAPGPHDLLAPPASWRFKHFSAELRVRTSLVLWGYLSAQRRGRCAAGARERPSCWSDGAAKGVKEIRVPEHLVVRASTAAPAS